jgi:hypothetical protein
MMARGATDGIIFAGPGNVGKEFRYDVTVGSPLDVLAISPPAKIVDFIEERIGAVKQRDVFLEKIPGFGVGNGSFVALVVLPVEVIGEMFERGCVEEPRRIWSGVIGG